MQVNTSQQCKQPLAANASPKPITNRTKRKSRWKLKFHHQALPPKYLDHYEASLQQPSAKMESSPPTSIPTSSNYSVVHSAISTKMSSCTDPTFSECTPFPSAHHSTVRYKDLPFMGEMTLDNSRPRRGRKPKKADICHLIYKNYGTTVVDEPLNLCLRDLQKNEPCQGISMCKFKFTAGAKPCLREKKNTPVKPSTGDRSKEVKKNRKSMAREKLEKTFKERGFLIQTQQLESAHGATYCKFRQLRKFTRYLFRSWKHHLPGDVVNTNSV